jgi:hypothetical protein
MKQPILIKHVLPFIAWYALMILITIAIDYFLHYFHYMHVGLYLGYVGTFLIIASFTYSLRKRKYITSGSPKQYLMFHEYVAWAGSVMILVHAGIHFNAQLAWLAVLMLLINVASGLVGTFLLKSAGDSLSVSRQELADSGISKEAADKELFFDAVIVNSMRKWRDIHLPISFMFGILSLLHIITVFMFKK